MDELSVRIILDILDCRIVALAVDLMIEKISAK
jgi:hypothetical protein